MAATKAPAVSGRVAALLGARPHTAAAAVASARAFTTLSPSAIESHNVGVLAMDAYIPPEFVAQSDLEQYYGVGEGKYTVGLGQKGMAFVRDNQDTSSICMTAVQNLLDKYNIDPKDVGRLEVGTESLTDKSKSTKTSLMHFFESHGNRDVEGATTMNACYGGSAALFNSAAWVESSAWDGRYALAVAADIAVYEEGAARPTGGAGAVAVLVGPGAPLRLVPQTRVTHAVDVYDFYKPVLSSEYPVVDGKLSQSCYIEAVDDCYNRHMAKVGRQAGDAAAVPDLLKAYDFSIFHSPYNKLVQQSFARLFVNDARRYAAAGMELPEHLAPLADFVDMDYTASITDRDLMKASMQVAGRFYEAMVGPGAAVSQQIGNTYTAAVFFNLLSLVSAQGAGLVDKKACVFSYGSGAIASMYGVQGVDTAADQYLDTLTHASSVTGTPTLAQLNGYEHPLGARGDKPFTLQGIADAADVPARLASRAAVDPAAFTQALDARKAVYGANSYTPQSAASAVEAGQWYLQEVKEDYSRVYGRA